jgi:hypothetical protein
MQATNLSFFGLLRKMVAFAIFKGTVPKYKCVDFDSASYIARTPKYKIIKKYLHKYFLLLIKSQIALEQKRIPHESRTLLIYVGKDSFGDANLELCGRSLLKDKAVKVDLLTLPKLIAQFEQDDIFENIYCSTIECKKNKYDYIILPEFNYRNINLKVRHYPKHRFVCLFGFFDGPARNQAVYSHAAINEVYGLGLSDEMICSTAKPYLKCNQSTFESIMSCVPRTDFFVISVGGIDPYRTYDSWDAFLECYSNFVAELNINNIVLIGSDNGLSASGKILGRKYQKLDVTSVVGKLSLLQTRALISASRLFVGCDGGLMHVAHSTNVPSVTLFSDKEPFRYWTTKACATRAIQSMGSANEIPAAAVAKGVAMALKRITAPNH